MKQIELTHLSFRYDQEGPWVLKDLSFSIEKGSYTAIIGHNGSGKSTVAKLLIGLLSPQQGTITIEGQSLSPDNINDIRSKVAIVFQNPDNQFIGSTVRDDIAFGLENRQIDPKAMDGIINYFAKEVGMEAYLDHEPSKLSGGQKQRVAIAGALAMAPDILILDEATAMLDPLGRSEINALVSMLHKKHGMTILSISHDIEEVVHADAVIVLNDGRLDYSGSPQGILGQQDHLAALSLESPFSVQLYNALKAQGIDALDPFDLERQVQHLCQLHSKK